MNSKQNVPHLYKFIDLISFKISKQKYSKLDNLLCDLIFSDEFSDSLKTRAIFSWMSFVDISTLAFDNDHECAPFFNKLKDGVSYAEAFQGLTRFLGIKSICIKGWAKGENYMAGDNIFESQPNHTWNAVLLHENWFLIDCFWSRKSSEEYSLEDFDDFFFCTEPDKMIYSHFPECSNWQLLNSPLSFENFINLPYVRPDFFKFKLSLEDNYYFEDVNCSYICFKINHSCGVNFSYKIKCLNKKDEKLCLNYFVFEEITDREIKYYFRPPFVGTFYLQIFAYPYFKGFEDDSIVHNVVIDFRINVHKCTDQPMPFPPCSDACWGIPQNYKYLLSSFYDGAYIINPNGKFSLAFNKLNDEKLFFRLINSVHSNDQLIKCLNIREFDATTEVSINLKDSLEYGLEIYLKKNPLDSKFKFCFQLLFCSKDYLNHNKENTKIHKIFENVPLEIQIIFNSVRQLKLKDEESNSLTYSQLFKSMCLESGFQCEIIQGYVKGKGYEIGKHFKDSDPLHAWNAVKIFDLWHLIDCNWIYNRIYEQPQHRSIVHITDEFYFLPSPQAFAYSHFPIDSKWQLLDQPITQIDFEKSLLFKSAYFKHNIKFISDYEGEIYTKEEIPFKFELNNESGISLSCSMEGSKMKSTNSSLDKYIMQFETGNVINFVTRFPFADMYQIVFYAKEKDDGYFEEICEFKIHYDGDEEMSPFPPSLQSLWGKSQFSKENNLICFRSNPKLETNEQGIVDLTISNATNFTFKTEVTRYDGDKVEKVSNQMVLIRKIEDKLLVTMSCSEINEYCLAICASSDFDKLKEYHLAFQFAVINKQKNIGITFPDVNCGFLGPQNVNGLFRIHLLEYHDYFVEFNDNIIQLKFKSDTSFKFSCKLLEVVKGKLISQPLKTFIQCKNDLKTINLILPSTNLFVLQLFALTANSLYVNVYNILLKSQNIKRTLNYPKQLSHWNGFLYQPLCYEIESEKQLFKLELKNAQKVVMRMKKKIISFCEIEEDLWHLETTFNKCGPIKVYILASFKNDLNSYHPILQYRISS